MGAQRHLLFTHNLYSRAYIKAIEHLRIYGPCTGTSTVDNRYTTPSSAWSRPRSPHRGPRRRRSSTVGNSRGDSRSIRGCTHGPYTRVHNLRRARARRRRGRTRRRRGRIHHAHAHARIRRRSH